MIRIPDFFKKTTFYEKSKIPPMLGIDQYYSDLQLGMIRKIWEALGSSKSIRVRKVSIIAMIRIPDFFKKTTFYEKSKIHPTLGIDQYYSDLQLGMIRKIWEALGVSKSIHCQSYEP